MRSAPRFNGLQPRSATTSRIGRAIKRTKTEPEQLLRRLLRAAGIRYRASPKHITGNPDFVLHGSRVAIFCDGDFWHGRNWRERKNKLAQGWNAAYWIQKIERNRLRDRQVSRDLRRSGWIIVRVWESDLKSKPKAALNAIREAQRDAQPNRVER